MVWTADYEIKPNVIARDQYVLTGIMKILLFSRKTQSHWLL